MACAPFRFRRQFVSRLLHAVMNECKTVRPTPGGGFAQHEVGGNRCFQGSLCGGYIGFRRQRGLCHIKGAAKTGGGMQDLLDGSRAAVEFFDEKGDGIFRQRSRGDAFQVSPPALARVKGQPAIGGEALQQLTDEEGVATGFAMDDGRHGRNILRGTHGRRRKLFHAVGFQRLEGDVGQGNARAAKGVQGQRERMPGAFCLLTGGQNDERLYPLPVAGQRGKKFE